MSSIFDDMTIEEQQAWWLEQAKKALHSFDMDKASIEWLAYTHNAVFSVQHKTEKHVLRLQHYTKVSHLMAEEELLAFLNDNGLQNQVPYPQKIFQSDDVVALLMTFVEGNEKAPETVSENEMFALGQFLGKLHEMPLTYRGKDHLPHLDWVGLFGKEGIYYPNDENIAVFSEEQLHIIAEVTQKVRFAMNEINQSGMFGLIHGDLLLKNILFHENKVRALDFEYCGWGYYLYDLTPILWQLKPQARYAQLEQALWDGYTSIRPLTERHRELLETFIAGRQVASMRWIAANQQNPYVLGKVEKILTQRTAELSAFLETGELKRE